MSHPFLSDQSEAIWFDKPRCDDAEKIYYEKKAGTHQTEAPTQVSEAKNPSTKSSLVSEIAKARQHIQNSLKTDDVPSSVGVVDNAVLNRLETLERENKELRKVTDDLRQLLKNIENRMVTMEGQKPAAPEVAAPAKAAESEDDDDDFELFGEEDEEETAAAEKLKEERISAYNSKKAKKPVLIAKSNIILDVKPWDDETDMAVVEKCVRSIEMDGLLWGASKLVPLAYGIKKLQICCVVVDDKVGTDDLEDSICAFEDYIQSIDIAAFNKI